MQTDSFIKITDLKMSAIFTPWSRLKWGLFPVERVVNEPQETEEKITQSIYDKDKDSESLTSLTESLEINPSDAVEYRRQSDRKWYHFFDEYEFRQSKKVRSTHKWYHWFNETDTPAEKKLILKLDVLLCLYSMMAYWVKYLDQTNLNNAYVSGLEEGINMKGNDLVHTQAVFTVGAIVFQLPFMYILYKVPLS